MFIPMLEFLKNQVPEFPFFPDMVMILILWIRKKELPEGHQLMLIYQNLSMMRENSDRRFSVWLL